MTNRAEVEAWLARYRRAWMTNDRSDIESLFADDAVYRPTPFADGWRGRDAIVDGWLARRDEPGAWTFEYRIVAVDDDVAVVETGISYPLDGPDYSNIWVVRMTDDGRAAEFTEWWVDRGVVDPGEPASRPGGRAAEA